ncbi:MAG: alpha/beta hydrolase-fold protein [Christensenellales bacterium]
MKNLSSQTDLILKIVISVAIVLITVAAYISFGFFFDVFAEAIPILLLPLITVPFIFLSKKLSRIGAIVSAAILIVFSIAASISVGVVATSMPAYGISPKTGKVETYTYSKDFMAKNYNIKQKTEINVYLPKNYTASKSYPVLYVLDGDMLFNYAAVKASEYSEASNGDVIVVGVGYGYWNPYFARGGIVYQDVKNVRGRWRDFCFADDTQEGYIKGTTFGGESKRGKEFTDFLVNTVVKDVKSRYSIDNSNSTILGHSLGGGIVSYLFTQYNPALKENCPFTNFVSVDNGYLDYYNKHYADLKAAMAANGNAAFSEINVYRIWGGDVNPPSNSIQFDTYERIKNEHWTNVNSYLWIPNGADHADTETIGIDEAFKLLLGMPFEHQTTL